jgi:hypothetical protein
VAGGKCSTTGIEALLAGFSAGFSVACGGGEKGAEMILAARAVLDPGRHVRQLSCFPAWLLLVVVAFATYDRQEEVEHGVWEERDR